jgi:hypothetical protein
MTKRITVIDNYDAMAAGGVGGSNNYIDVDVIPANLNGGELGLNVSRGDIAVPITLLDSDNAPILNTVCTGWQEFPNRLYIDALNQADIPGPVRIISAMNHDIMSLLQSGQLIYGAISGAVYSITTQHGVAHKLDIEQAGTILIETALQGAATPFGHYEQVFNGGHVTRLLLVDTLAAQPALAWGINGTGSLRWEAGSPQFVAGKTRLMVEIAHFGDDQMGSFKLFA